MLNLKTASRDIQNAAAALGIKSGNWEPVNAGTSIALPGTTPWSLEYPTAARAPASPLATFATQDCTSTDPHTGPGLPTGPRRTIMEHMQYLIDNGYTDDAGRLADHQFGRTSYGEVVHRQRRHLPAMVQAGINAGLLQAEYADERRDDQHAAGILTLNTPPAGVNSRQRSYIMNTSEQINELAAALATAQGSISAAKYDGTNPHLKNRYTTLSAVWDAIRKPLSDNGLAVVQVVDMDSDGMILSTSIDALKAGGISKPSTRSRQAGPRH